MSRLLCDWPSCITNGPAAQTSPHACLRRRLASCASAVQGPRPLRCRPKRLRFSWKTCLAVREVVRGGWSSLLMFRPLEEWKQIKRGNRSIEKTKLPLIIPVLTADFY